VLLAPGAVAQDVALRKPVEQADATTLRVQCVGTDGKTICEKTLR